MTKIFVDKITFKCHTEQNDEGTLIPYETDFFDGKCQTFIEGYRFVPSGESWTRSDGVVFEGEMISSWKDYHKLDNEQRKYEQALIADMQNALNTLGVKV